MKVYTYTLSLTFLILSFTAGPLCAQDRPGQIRGYPDAEQAVEITELRLLGNATKGANVTLQVRFRAYVDGPGTIMLRYPKHVAPPGRRPEDTYRTKSLRLKEEKTYVKTYPMRVYDTGGAMVSAIVQAEDPPEDYDAGDSEHVNVVSGTDTYQVFAPGDTTRRRVTATSGGAGTSNTTAKAEAKSSTYYTVSVSGQIEYLDENEFPNRVEGLYGSEVELWFRDTDTGNLYHPVGGESEHVHYDRVAEDGSYHFDFSFTGDLSAYEELLVLVGSKNDAANLSIGQGAWTIEGETFFNPSQGVAIDISGMGTNISASSADAEVNSRDGAVLRNMQLSRELVKERYNNSTPFSLPVIRVYREPISPAGLFCEPEDNVGGCSDRGNFPYIIVDSDDTDLELSAHEYGHYINYRMWGGGDGPMNNLPTRLKEGWAIFVSFAARNYGSQAYGDELDRRADNPEEDAFEKGTRNDGSSYRFRGISYADGGNPSYAAFACYLWSLYDSYSGGAFEVARYSGDNETVSGFPLRVFGVYRVLKTVGGIRGLAPNVALYRDVFKNGSAPVGVPALNSRVKTSVSSVGTFMMSDYTDVPDSPMRPPQLTDASGQIKSDGDVSLQWTTRSYPAGRDYGNYPDGYRLYKDGSAAATVAPDKSSYTYDPNGTNSGTYRLTAYNAAGKARGNSSVTLGIDASISGPTRLKPYERGTWTASPSGGSYEWEYKPTSSLSTWYDENCTGPECEHTFINSTSRVQTGGIRVTVNKNGKTDMVTTAVEVAADCDGFQQAICLYGKSGSRAALRDLRARSSSASMATLTWKASGPLSASRFTVQRRPDSTTAWSKAGVVQAEDSITAETTGAEDGPTYRFKVAGLKPGTHQFRLVYTSSRENKDKQRMTETVTATVEMNEAYRLSTYPNPVRERATLKLAVKEAQDVTVAVYDVLGRRVTTLHDGRLPAQETERLSVNASREGLSSGTYFVRVQGEGFVATERLTVVQ